MITSAQLADTFKGLGLRGRPVLVHASLRSFGIVSGGAQAVVQALLAAFETVVVPAHTYRTMVTPLDGPPDNGIAYGRDQALNRLARIYSADMPADPLMGKIPEELRRMVAASRSMHPILSFAGVRAEAILAAQTLAEPLAPIRALAERDGWALLLGVDHTANTSIHYAEKMAGRRQFIRWALTEDGVKECPGFPGCSEGFQAIAPSLERYNHSVRIGNALAQAVPLAALFAVVIRKIQEDPLALLCQRVGCLRCKAVRESVTGT